ncbi:EPIDERMAL PATTERNING FACTOR-like protein [Arachis hypogaea]|nr:EPIDERMAL PATTERNING FACTOR-like protein [Arachis hypogaea]
MTSRSSKTTRASSVPSFGVAARHVQPHMEKKEKRATTGDGKRLRGPGSWLPSCRSKRGWCSPCDPVHVLVQPGMIIRLEYYPEA